MHPRILKAGRILLILLLVGGILLCGPAHHALHSDPGGASCDVCKLTGTELPEAVQVPGPAATARVATEVAPVDVFVPPAPTVGSPRGPPASA